MAGLASKTAGAQHTLKCCVCTPAHHHVLSFNSGLPLCDLARCGDRRVSIIGGLAPLLVHTICLQRCTDDQCWPVANTFDFMRPGRNITVSENTVQPGLVALYSPQL